MTTTDLVPVFTGTLAGQDIPLCNARDLHAALGVGCDFSSWIKRRIDDYGFVEGEDYSSNLRKIPGRRGQPATDYHLTLDTAKELSIVENNEIGRSIRRYLIALEKKQGAALSLQAHLSAPIPTFANRRWIVVVSPDGRETARPLDPEHFLCKLDELPGLIRDPGFLVDGTLLVEIVHACADRLAGKLAGRAINRKPRK